MKITIEARLGCSPLTGDAIRVQISATRREVGVAREVASSVASALVGTLASARRAARAEATEAELQAIVREGRKS